MTYSPRTFRKGNQSAVAHSYSSETDLLFDGWLPDPSTPPAADLRRHVEVGELATLVPAAATPAQLAADPALRAAFVPSTDVYLSRYGVKGDGITDDTPAIAAALAAAGTLAASLRAVAPHKRVTVHGDARAIYYIASSTTTSSWYMPSGTVQTQKFSLAIPSGVTVDLHGGHMQFAAADGALICNAGATTNSSYTTLDRDLGLVNATIDGGNVARALQTNLVDFRGVDGLRLSLRVTNVIGGAVQLFNVQNANCPLIDVDGVVGVGIGLGQPIPATQNVRNSNFGLLRVRNVTINPQNTFNYPGNPIAGAPVSSTIDTIDVGNCSAGIKFDNLSSDLAIGKVVGFNLGDSQGNSGIKLQGVAGRPVTRITIGSIQMTGCSAHGLYADYTQDCSIGSYWGAGNQTLGTGPDVWLGGTRDHVTSIKSDSSGGDAVLLRSYAADTWVGKISARNPGQVPTSTSGQGLAITPGATGTVGDLYAIDDQATALSAALSTGTPITSLPVNTVGPALSAGTVVVVSSGSNTQSFTLSGSTAAGATTLPVNSLAPNFAFPSGANVTTPTMVHGLGFPSSSLFLVGRYKTLGSRGGGHVAGSNGGLVQNVVAQNGPPMVGSIGIPAAASLVEGQAVRTQLKVGQYYAAIPASGFTTGNSVGNGALRLAPFPVPRNIGLASIAAAISAAGDPGTTLRLGVYADDGTGYPGALLLDAGTIAADSVGTKEVQINTTTFPGNSAVSNTGLALQGGSYWIGAAVAGPTVTLTTALAAGTAVTALSVSAIPNALASGASVVVSTVSGAAVTAQTFTLSAAASAGATSLTVNSVTPTSVYSVGTSVALLSTVPTLHLTNGGIGAISLGGSLPAGNSGTAAYSQTGIIGALPTAFTTSVAVAGACPRVFVKAGA